MHLIIDESIVSEIPDLLPSMLEAWPGTSAMISSAPLSTCFAAVDNRSADAAIVRLQGIDADSYGKLSAIPIVTSLDGTTLVYPGGGRTEMFTRLRDAVQARLKSNGGQQHQVWL